MPAHESSITMDTKVRYQKGGKKNGYLPDTFDRPPDWGENEYTDEDEVFVDSPNMDLSSATRPLMYPRARTKTKLSRGSRCRRCRPVVNAVCCFLFLVLSLGSLMGLVVYYVNKHNKSKTEHFDANKQIPPSPDTNFVTKVEHLDYSDIVGCDNVQVEDVWVKGIPKLLTESAFRLVDINQDGTLDVVVGFATGADGYSIPSIVCDIYFDGNYPCFGGLLALEGNTGQELWRHYSDHELYSINCDVDFNKDGVVDCLSAGRAGAFQAISGKDGSLIWNFGKQEAKNDIMNLYTAQIIPDIDGDGTVDVLTIHGGDPLQEPGSAYRLSGRILLMSGSTGHVIRWLGVPDQKESYYSPQLYTRLDGTRVVLFGTGGETHGGSLWAVKLDDLIRGDITKAQAIYSDSHKGVMTPPVLVDITADGVEDIVIPTFNSSVLAIDGMDFHIIWNYTFPQSESYNTPSPGYYNNDLTPDFLVKYAHGPGFPVYYHSATTVLDGRTGRPLIDPPPRDTVGAQASGVTISMEGRGHDVFIYWAADCKNHTGEGGEFEFVKGTNVHEQSRSDFCRLRFKTKGYSKIYALSRHLGAPGATIYNSEERFEVEHNKWINTTLEGLEFVRSHPEWLEQYRKFSDYVPHEDTPDDVQEDDIPFYPKEGGGESLFEDPIFDDSERTSYKKGPAPGAYRKPYIDNVNSNGLLDYDYDIPDYADDSYSRFPDNGYNKPPARGRFDNYPHYKPPYRRPGSGIFQPTTPAFKYARNRYRERYPPNSRIERVKERTPEGQGTSTKVKATVKPIAMKAARGKRQSGAYIENKYKYSLDDDNLFLQNHKSDTVDENHIKTSDNMRGQNLNRKRKRRHIGPHDEEGLQRLLSTGTLAPSSLPLTHPNYNHSIDFIFATYWFFPAKTRAILPEDQKCIEEKLSEETIRFDPNSEYFGLDHDAYDHAVTDECLTKSGRTLPEEGTYESQTQYNPFNVHMGQMTVYRVRLTCTCSNKTLLETGNKRCGRVLPFGEQQWTAYMGNRADSHWHPRRNY